MNLVTAIKIACEAHDGQLDKGGQPYILHPLRIMLKMEDDDSRVVAVLHDVVEDSGVTLHGLRERGFSKSVLEAVDCLTKKPDEEYDTFIARVGSNKLARRVKIEDLKDNLDMTRLKNVSEKDIARLIKYHKALAALLD